MNELHMAQYWIDKKGLETAITDYYPDTLAKDPSIAAALTQIKNAERAILARIKELQSESPDCEEL